MRFHIFSFFSLRKNRAKLVSLSIVLLFCLSFLVIALPQVKADTYSAVTSTSVVHVDNNQGTNVNLNGYNVYVTDTDLLFYSATNGVLVKDIYLSFIYSNPMSRVSGYNSTFLMVAVASASGATTGTAYVPLAVDFVNTVNFHITSLYNSTTGFGVYTGGYLSNFVRDDIIFVVTNNIHYVVVSGSWHNSGTCSLTGILKVLPSGGTIVTTYYSTSDLTKSYLNGNSIWIYSQTNINTIYVLTAQCNSSYDSSLNTIAQILKINFVTPSLTVVSSTGITSSYSNWVYYIDSNYESWDGTNYYYDLLFAFPVHGVNHNFFVELIRFNDSGVAGSSYSVSYLDSNSATNEIRPMSCFMPSYNYGNNTLTNGQFGISYIGMNYIMKSVGFTLSNLNTTSPTWAISGSSSYQVYDLTNPFTSSNNVGGFISPFTGTNMFMVDYQANQVCTDFTYITNPITLIIFTINPISLGESSNGVTPYGITSEMLSSQSSYIYNVMLYYSGHRQNVNSFTLYTTGEGTVNTEFNLKPNTLVGSGSPNSSNFTFQVSYSYGAYTSNVYELYQLNITSSNVNNVPFYFQLTWSNTLTVTGGTIGGGGGTGGGGSGASEAQIIAIFTNWRTDALLIIYGIVCGLCTSLFAFTGLVAGLNISTVVCFAIGLLGSLMYPVLGLIVIADLAFIVLGSGLLNKTPKPEG